MGDLKSGAANKSSTLVCHMTTVPTHSCCTAVCDVAENLPPVNLVKLGSFMSV